MNYVHAHRALTKLKLNTAQNRIYETVKMAQLPDEIVRAITDGIGYECVVWELIVLMASLGIEKCLE